MSGSTGIWLQGFEDGVRTLGSVAFDERGQRLYTQMMTKHAWLNRDPTQGKNFSGVSLNISKCLMLIVKPSSRYAKRCFSDVIG